VPGGAERDNPALDLGLVALKFVDASDLLAGLREGDQASPLPRALVEGLTHLHKARAAKVRPPLGYRNIIRLPGKDGGGGWLFAVVWWQQCRIQEQESVIDAETVKGGRIEEVRDV